MKEENAEKVREVAAKVLQAGKEWWERPGSDGKSPKDRFEEEIRRRLETLGEVLSPNGLKVALSYKEESRYTLTFEDLVSYVKGSYRLTPGVRICVLKTEGDIPQLDIMVCDADNNVDFGPTCPWTHFIVGELDARLLEMFAGKSMLVLK